MNYTTEPRADIPCGVEVRETVLNKLANLDEKIKDSLERTYRLMGVITGDAPEFPKLEEPRCLEQQLMQMLEYASRLESALAEVQGKMGF